MLLSPRSRKEWSIRRPRRRKLLFAIRHNGKARRCAGPLIFRSALATLLAGLVLPTLLLLGRPGQKRVFMAVLRVPPEQRSQTSRVPNSVRECLVVALSRSPANRFALESAQAYVRFGSQADVCTAKGHVRFAPNSDRKSRHAANGHVRFTAKSRHVRRTSRCRLRANS